MFLTKCHKVYKEIFVSHNKGNFPYSKLDNPTSLSQGKKCFNKYQMLISKLSLKIMRALIDVIGRP